MDTPMEKPVVIFGAGGLGKAALEIFKSNNILVYGFLDDDEDLQDTIIDEVAVLGNTDHEEILHQIGTNCEAFIAIEDLSLRKSLIEMLNEERKVMPVNALHQQANIAESATLGHGCFFNAGVNIGSYANTGHHCIFNTNVTVEYNSIIEDFVQLGPGVIVSPGATIKENAIIGAGAIISGKVTIEKNALVGPGSVVIENIEENGKVFGNPAKAF